MAWFRGSTGLVARALTVVAAATVIAIPLADSTAASGAASPHLTLAVGPSFGTLNAAPEHAAAETAAGLRSATIELSWARAEPLPGVFDTAYVASIAAWAKTLTANGMTLTLGLGMHYTPSWLLALPGSRYVDEHGNVSGEPDFVFSQTVRNAATTYLTYLSHALGFAQFAGIRLSSGGDAEMLYPPGGSYWAFSSGAQNGPDKPPSLAPNPIPGWTPGTPGQSAAAVQAWLDWYVGGLDNVTNWQLATLRSLGFSGHFDTLTPGSGVRPDQVAALVGDNLPDGLAGVGAVWQLFYAGLPAGSDVEAYISSVADGSGGDDLCLPTDSLIPVSSGLADSWSATRWITRLAQAYGFATGGENPGYSTDPTYSAHYTDPGVTGLAATAVRQAVSCGFKDFYWAHDNQFWDGTLPLSTYTKWILPSFVVPLVTVPTLTHVAVTRTQVTVSVSSLVSKLRPATGYVHLRAGALNLRGKLVNGRAVFHLHHHLATGTRVVATYGGDQRDRASSLVSHVAKR